MYGYVRLCTVTAVTAVFTVFTVFSVYFCLRLCTVMYDYVRLPRYTAVIAVITVITVIDPVGAIPRYFLGFYGNRGTVTVTVKYRGYGILRLP